MSARAKPKRQRGRAVDLELLDDAKPSTAGKIVQAHGDSLSAKPTDNGKARRRRNPAKTKKKAKTANELMFEVWKYTWENRHRRLTKP